MRKIITCILILVSFCFCGLASAGVIEEIEANYTPKSWTEKYINDVGAEVVVKKIRPYSFSEYKMFFFSMMLIDSKRTGRYAAFDFGYLGPDWVFIENMSVGDGNSKIILQPAEKPERNVESYRSVKETMIFFPTREDLVFMKNTKLLRLHTAKGHYDIKFGNVEEGFVPFDKAIDYAIRFVDGQ